MVGSTENDPTYQKVQTANQLRQYSFLFSMIEAALAVNRPMLSQPLIKALNHLAIVGLHHEAGQYRSTPVKVNGYVAPLPYRVEPLMDDFVNWINWQWASASAGNLAAHALWKLNHIHPFINGNGRTARAVSYFILCSKYGRLLPGTTIVPELLRSPDNYGQYIAALRKADMGDITPLTNLLLTLLLNQINTASFEKP